MAAASAGGLAPLVGHQAASDDDIVGNSFERARRAAEVRADARFVAQEALFVFASELRSPVSEGESGGERSAALPNTGASSSSASGMPGATTLCVTAASAPSTHQAPGWQGGPTTPHRKRELPEEKLAPPSPEDSAAWECVAHLTQSCSPSSLSVESPLRRIRLSESTSALGPASSSSTAPCPVLDPVPPSVVAVNNLVAATQLDSVEQGDLDADVMDYLRSPAGDSPAANGAEPSAAPAQPADTPNWECMSASSESSGSTSVDTTTMVNRMIRDAELAAELEEE